MSSKPVKPCKPWGLNRGITRLYDCKTAHNEPIDKDAIKDDFIAVLETAFDDAFKNYHPPKERRAHAKAQARAKKTTAAATKTTKTSPKTTKTTKTSPKTTKTTKTSPKTTAQTKGFPNTLQTGFASGTIPAFSRTRRS